MATKRHYGKTILEMKESTEYCFYCGKKISPRNKTIDHIMPIKNGGSNCADNLVICCRKCNNNKGGYTVSGLIEQLKIRLRFADANKRKHWEREIEKWTGIKERLKLKRKQEENPDG